MKKLLIMLMALAALLPAAVRAQEAAGRVLATSGTVTVERGLVVLPAQAGTPVLSGDTLRLGAASNAQIRFSDDSVVALGPDTVFQVSDYAYQGLPAAAQRVVFTLVQGGMRTVTGLLGKAGSNYRVQTTVAAVGIRGTGFSACHDCTSISGEFLPGTSVAFSEGAGYVRTSAGELDLVAGQSAYAPAATALPVRTTSFPQLRQTASARPNSSSTRTAQSTEGVEVAVPGGSGGDGSAGVSAAVGGASPTPVFQVTSTPAVDTVVGSGTVFYRLAGPFSLPVTCTGGGCANAIDGEMVLAVNYSLKRVTALAAIKFADGPMFNVSIPIAVSGIPVTISGNQVSFSGTFNEVDFPLNVGSFLCSNCGPNDGFGTVPQLTVSGTINGSQATVTFKLSDPAANESGTITATLPQVALPNNTVAAYSIPLLGGGVSTRSASYWDVTVDSSGRLLRAGPNVGAAQIEVGGATNTIAGTAPAAGNLVWGTWTAGSTAATRPTITDTRFNVFQPGTGTVMPWITGEAAPFIPPSVGTLEFNAIGSVFQNPNVHLNSAKLLADFVNRSIQLSINVSAAPGTAGTNVYQLNATTGLSPSTNRFSSGFSSMTCTGPCNNGTGQVGGSFGGFLSGPAAQGAGLVFTAGYGGAAIPGVGNGVTGAVAFGR